MDQEQFLFLLDLTEELMANAWTVCIQQRGMSHKGQRVQGELEKLVAEGNAGREQRGEEVGFEVLEGRRARTVRKDELVACGGVANEQQSTERRR